MRRVYRRDCRCPSKWQDDVRKALPKYHDFMAAAAAFEKLALNSVERRAGFSAYAPQVLVVKNGKVQFPAIWGKQKEIIARMSCRKCVYCEGPINAPRAAHVEHFRPKSLFPLGAYEWRNYFLGCPGCNGAKSDKWPERGGYIRPDAGDPSLQFVFFEDGKVHAKRAVGAAERMLQDFDLNRKWLVYRRKRDIGKMLKLLDVAVHFLKEGDRDVAGRLARTLLHVNDAPDSAYSVALTQCFRRAWKRASSDGAL